MQSSEIRQLFLDYFKRGFLWDTVNKCLKSFEKGGS